tara:strand:- start:54 stop:494 length:441 start_codon:yes stop_codon:yes gene_type:complete
MTQNKFAGLRPQMKISNQWVDLTQKNTDLPDYLMAESVRDALVVIDRVWFNFLENVSSGCYWITKEGIQKRTPVRLIRKTVQHPNGIVESYTTGEVEEYFPPNPFEKEVYKNDPNLWIALQARGYVHLNQEQILEAAEKHSEELAK